MTGTFSCADAASGNPGPSGSYVINAGHANVQTWEAAILTFDSGGTGVFIQTASALGTPTVFKGSRPVGPVTCQIKSEDGTLNGQVTGRTVTAG